MKTTFSNQRTEYTCYLQTRNNDGSFFNTLKAILHTEKEANKFCKDNGYFWQCDIISIN